MGKQAPSSTDDGSTNWFNLFRGILGEIDYSHTLSLNISTARKMPKYLCTGTFIKQCMEKQNGKNNLNNIDKIIKEIVLQGYILCIH